MPGGNTREGKISVAIEGRVVEVNHAMCWNVGGCDVLVDGECNEANEEEYWDKDGKAKSRLFEDATPAKVSNLFPGSFKLSGVLLNFSDVFFDSLL